jgi:hypothetical protein
MTKNPPRRRIKKSSANKLKYFSMKDLIPGPNLLKRAATAKKRKDLLMAEAVIKRGRFSLKTPEAIVNIL